MKDLLTQIRTLYERLLGQGRPPSREFLVQKFLETKGIGELPATHLEAIRAWWNKVHQWSFLQEVLPNPEVREILIHGSGPIQIDRNGELETGPAHGLGREDIQLCLEVLALSNNISWNYSMPFASFHLELGGQLFRATLIHASLTPQLESKLFLRKYPRDPYPLSCFQLGPQQENLINKLLSTKKNILISGATNSGKTSLLNSLIDLAPRNEHLIIIEDTHEIFSPRPTHTHLLAQGQLAQKSMVELTAFALRLRPDRIVLGEIRQKEIVPMILGLNTGHRGFISTIHADTALDALRRSALLMALFSGNGEFGHSLAIKLVTQNIDYVIHLERRMVKEIIKVMGIDNDQPMIDRVF